MRPRSAARLAWSLSGVAIGAAAVAVGLLIWNAGVAPEGTFGPPGSIVLFALVFGSVGGLVASRRPENPIGWILLAVGVLTGGQEVGQQYAVRALIVDPGSLPGGAWGAWFGEWIWVPVTSSVVIFMLLLFPTGTPPSARWRWVFWLGGASVFTASVALALMPRLEGFAGIPSPFPFTSPAAESVVSVGMVGYLAAAAASVGSLVLRYRRAVGEERAQVKWIATAGAAAVIALILGVLGQLSGVAVEAFAIPIILGFISIPLAAGIAILKYRLFDIDLVINRAVVYALLAAFVTALYVGIVVGIGAAAGRRGGLLLPGVAAAVVALVFHPARLRAQRFANRLVYGNRATPYEVLSEFADRLGTAYSVEDVLPRMARMVAEGTGAARAEVWLHVGDGVRRAAAWPPETGDAGSVPLTGDELPELPNVDRTLPVRHHGELLGALAVVTPRGEGFRPAEEALLQDLASQAGLVLRNVRLTEELRANLEELRASRQRIVAAQDTERRRLERDIHDGAQQQLVALAVKLRLAETLVDRDPAKAKELLGEVKADSTRALEDLRDLARGIFPPLLADRGLVAALEAQAGKSPVSVRVESDGLGRYPGEVEAAVYFCCLEALQNVAKYAGASGAIVRVWSEDGTLRFAVRDDGRGFDPRTTRRGSGLQNMADRLEALGGVLDVRSSPGEGTTVEGRIPLRDASSEAPPRSSERSPAQA